VINYSHYIADLPLTDCPGITNDQASVHVCCGYTNMNLMMMGIDSFPHNKTIYEYV